MPLKAITPESANRMTCLVIGPAGIGKTSLLRTIPADEKVCTLSAEAGLLCVRDLVTSGQVEGFEIGSLNDFKEAYEWLSTNQEAQARYIWVFIDSLTEIAGRCVEHWKAKYPNKDDSFNLWGGYADQMAMLIKAFRDLQPYNIVFTCLEEQDKDQLKRIYYGPAIEGKKIKERLTSFFDEVFYYNLWMDDNQQEYRALLTQPFDRRPAKDRSGKLNSLETPDLSLIKAKIMNGGN